MPLRAAVLLIVVCGAAGVAAQRAATRAADAIPPLSMTCPMHPDIVESRPGSCPLCKMPLVPVRLDTAWMCPVHTTVMDEHEGTCRICRRALIQARVAVTWTCLAQPGIERLEPGICADGSAMVRRRTLRPHGNHNPQHGGQFFMAPDNWHHLEGTYPRDRVFRLYLYDDYARPLPAADLKRVQARVVTRETWEPATRTATELAAFPLRVGGNGSYLEGRIEAVKLPAEMTAKVRIKPGGPEYRFDFTFQTLTKEPVVAVAAARAPAAAAGPTTQNATPRPPGGPPAVAPSATAPMSPATRPDAGAPPVPPALESADPALAPLEIPATMGGMVEELQRRERYIRTFIEQGNFGAVWVPAFHAKDLAVALEPHIGHLPPSARAIAEPALQQVVRLAWLLDAFGDVGNRQQLESAHSAFAAAVADVAKAFAEAG